MVKNLKIFQMLFLIVQFKRFGTLNAPQKTEALCKAPFLKNLEKLPEISRFDQKMHF